MPNWIDTEGRPFGMVFWRFFLPEGEVETPRADGREGGATSVAESVEAEPLVDQAVETTGLDDFGDDDVAGRARRLVDSLNDEAALNELGEAIVGGRARRLPRRTGCGVVE